MFGGSSVEKAAAALPVIMIRRATTRAHLLADSVSGVICELHCELGATVDLNKVESDSEGMEGNRRSGPQQRTCIHGRRSGALVLSTIKWVLLPSRFEPCHCTSRSKNNHSSSQSYLGFRPQTRCRKRILLPNPPEELPRVKSSHRKGGPSGVPHTDQTQDTRSSRCRCNMCCRFPVGEASQAGTAASGSCLIWRFRPW